MFFFNQKQKENTMRAINHRVVVIVLAVIFCVTSTSFAQQKCYLPSDYYPTTVSGLSSVYFGDFDITEAVISPAVSGGTHTPVPLRIDDCHKGYLGVTIPWSEAARASALATMNIFTTPCNNDLPTQVSITLLHGHSCTLKAYDVHGTLLDTAIASPLQHTPQTLTLKSISSGIETIEFDGAEICVIEVCIGCNEGGGPGPDPQAEPEDYIEKIKKAREEGYNEGYAAGLAAAASLNSDSCAIVEENYDITIPCLDVSGQTFPIRLFFQSENAELFSSDAVWGLTPDDVK